MTNDRNRDGTTRLCLALYGEERASAWIGGSNARMLHDAADQLLATRRALKMAQARAMRNRDWYACCLSWRESGEKRERARRLIVHWISKFEREAKELSP